jgi:hypothetical protein
MNAVCIGGSGKEMGEWQMVKPVLLKKEENLPTGQAGWWTCRLDLSDEVFPLAYKYGIYNKKKNASLILKREITGSYLLSLKKRSWLFFMMDLFI